MVGKEGRRKSIPIKSGVTTVGRRPDCQVRIPLSVVSREHCRISNVGGVLSIQDLGSANGTYVNENQITESEIKSGDRVKIGTVDFLIQIEGESKGVSSVDSLADAKDASGSALGQLSDSFTAMAESMGESAGDSLSDLDLSADDSFS